MSAPSYWRKLSFDQHDAVYENIRSKNHERVVIQTFKRQDHSSSFFQSMLNNPSIISAARERYFNHFGMSYYAILDMRLTKYPDSPFKKMLVIQSQFRSITGAEVQSFERQFVDSDRMYVVTYMIEEPALNNRSLARIALNFFRPIFHHDQEARLDPSGDSWHWNVGSTWARIAGLSQRSWSSISALFSSQANADQVAESGNASDQTSLSGNGGVSNWTDPAAGVLWGEPGKPLVRDYKRLRQHCVADGIPDNEVIGPDARGWSTVALNSATQCLKGGWESVKGIVTGTWALAKNVFHSVYSYTTNGGSTRDEVNASVGAVASELIHHPKELLARIRSVLGKVLWKNVGEPYLCLNIESRVRILCSIMAGLIPIGIVAKLVLNIPLKSAELARLASGSKRAFALVIREGKSAKMGEAIDIRGIAHVPVTGGSGDTLSKIAGKFKKRGIDTYVRDFTQEEKKHMYAYSGTNEAGKPTMVFQRSTLKNPEMDAGTIAHEATHATNTLHASDKSANDLQKIRTIRLSSSGGLKLHTTPTYEDYFRIDEIQARAVESGVSINRAKKYIYNGNKKAAIAQLDSARYAITQAQEFQANSRYFLNAARAAIYAPEKSFWYNPLKGDATIVVTGVSSAKSAEEFKELIQLQNKNPNSLFVSIVPKGNTLRVSFKIGKGLYPGQARLRVQEMLSNAMDDSSRFTKNFKINMDEINSLRQQLGLPPL